MERLLLLGAPTTASELVTLKSPLHLAIRNFRGLFRLECVKLLLTAGASVHVRDQGGNNCFHELSNNITSFTSDDTYIRTKRNEEGEEEKGKGRMNEFDVELVAILGRTMLDFVANTDSSGYDSFKGRVRHVINQRNQAGETPLFILCKQSPKKPSSSSSSSSKSSIPTPNAVLASLLLAAGGDVMVSDVKRGRNCFHAAVNSNQEDMVSLIVNQGDRGDRCDMISEEREERYDEEEQEDWGFLNENRSNQNSGDNVDVSKLLLSKTLCGQTALHLACLNKNTPMVQLLLQFAVQYFKLGDRNTKLSKDGNESNEDVNEKSLRMEQNRHLSLYQSVANGGGCFHEDAISVSRRLNDTRTVNILNKYYNKHCCATTTASTIIANIPTQTTKIATEQLDASVEESRQSGSIQHDINNASVFTPAAIDTVHAYTLEREAYLKEYNENYTTTHNNTTTRFSLSSHPGNSSTDLCFSKEHEKNENMKHNGQKGLKAKSRSAKQSVEMKSTLSSSQLSKFKSLKSNQMARCSSISSFKQTKQLTSNNRNEHRRDEESKYSRKSVEEQQQQVFEDYKKDDDEEKEEEGPVTMLKEMFPYSSQSIMCESKKDHPNYKPTSSVQTVQESSQHLKYDMTPHSRYFASRPDLHKKQSGTNNSHSDKETGIYEDGTTTAAATPPSSSCSVDREKPSSRHTSSSTNKSFRSKLAIKTARATPIIEKENKRLREKLVKIYERPSQYPSSETASNAPGTGKSGSEVYGYEMQKKNIQKLFKSDIIYENDIREKTIFDDIEDNDDYDVDCDEYEDYVRRNTKNKNMDNENDGGEENEDDFDDFEGNIFGTQALFAYGGGDEEMKVSKHLHQKLAIERAALVGTMVIPHTLGSVTCAACGRSSMDKKKKEYFDRPTSTAFVPCLCCNGSSGGGGGPWYCDDTCRQVDWYLEHRRQCLGKSLPSSSSSSTIKKQRDSNKIKEMSIGLGKYTNYWVVDPKFRKAKELLLSHPKPDHLTIIQECIQAYKVDALIEKKKKDEWEENLRNPDVIEKEPISDARKSMRKRRVEKANIKIRKEWNDRFEKNILHQIETEKIKPVLEDMFDQHTRAIVLSKKHELENKIKRQGMANDEMVGWGPQRVEKMWLKETIEFNDKRVHFGDEPYRQTSTGHDIGRNYPKPVKKVVLKSGLAAADDEVEVEVEVHNYTGGMRKDIKEIGVPRLFWNSSKHAL